MASDDGWFCFRCEVRHVDADPAEPCAACGYVNDAEPPVIKAGLHFDLPESEYHGHPTSLSQSGIKVLLESPARFDYERRNPQPPTQAMEFGTVAHMMRLGVGPEVVVVEVDNKRGKAWSEPAEAARAAGKIPLTTAEHKTVCDMAEAADRDPIVKALLSGGQPEVSAFWPDEQTGVLRRGRFDYLRDDLLVDYKTAANASPRSFGRTAHSFGYYIQHPYYVDLARDCDMPDVRSLVFLVQDKRPPYCIAALELDTDAVKLGREKAAKALQVYRDCTEAGIWPAWTDVNPNYPITRVSLPGYAFFDEEPAA